jgi:replicative DNA helicase
VNGDRLPPHDTDAEEAVIGSLLIDGSAIYQVATLIQPASFFDERNAQIYGACLELYQRNEAINQITLAQELDRQGKLEACGGTAYLSQLISIVPTSLDVEHYAQIVYRLSVMRHLIGAGNQIAAIGYAADPNVESSLNKAEDALFRLRQGQFDRDLVPIRQVLDKYFEETAPHPTAEEGEAEAEVIPHVMSGFAGLDDFLSGFQRSDLIIVAGRPSMGKTSLALNIARNAAVERKACVALFSLEMARESLVLRLLSSESGVNLRHVRNIYQRGGTELTREEEQEERRIMDASGVLAEAPIYIDDSPQLRVVEMRSKARRLYYERGLNLIIVDHLGLMQADGRVENRVQEISYISRSLKAVARDLNIPVLVVSQLSRASEWRASHRPQLSDLRDSGSIEQDADVVIFIYRDDYYYNKEEWETQHPDREYPEGMAEIIVAKHRNGPTGQISLRFRPQLARFENIANAEPSLL